MRLPIWRIFDLTVAAKPFQVLMFVKQPRCLSSNPDVRSACHGVIVFIRATGPLVALSFTARRDSGTWDERELWRKAWTASKRPREGNPRHSPSRHGLGPQSRYQWLSHHTGPSWSLPFCG
jgi:hypothetical protein